MSVSCVSSTSNRQKTEDQFYDESLVPSVTPRHERTNDGGHLDVKGPQDSLRLI